MVTGPRDVTDFPATRPERQRNEDGRTVVIVDHIPAFGAGLAMILEQGGFEVARPAHPIAWLRDRTADAAMVTVHSSDDLESLCKLGSEFPDLVVVTVLLSSEPADYMRALRSGAHAAVGWDSRPEEITEVVTSAMAGRTVLPTVVAQSLSRSLPAQLWDKPLSPDEIRWLRILARGGSVVQLAKLEGYSQREIFRRLAAVYRRLGVRNRHEAIALAGQWGVLTSGEIEAAWKGLA